MATSPSHAFGQHLGNLLERVLEPTLQSFCAKHGLFLDKKGQRLGVRGGRKLSWIDGFKNKHDLDFVIETQGSPSVQGRPLAFIEVAWRSYTKHSKAKAQEIQGAVLPLADLHRFDRPFLGAVLAGAFTEPSREQLTSNGFCVLYVPTESVVSAFATAGINISYAEDTPDTWFEAKLKEIQGAGNRAELIVAADILARHKDDYTTFLGRLEARVSSQIEKVVVIPLFGTGIEFGSITTAIEYLGKSGNRLKPTDEFQKYEVRVTYNNGSTVDAQFPTTTSCIAFLERMGL